MNFKYFRIFLEIFIGVVLLVSGYLVGLIHMNRIVENRVLEHLTDRLEIDKSWDAVEDYVYCDIFEFGKTIDEVESELAEVDFFGVTYHSTIDDEIWHVYYFENKQILRHLQKPVLWFDENDELIRKEIWGSSLDGYLPVDCP